MLLLAISLVVATNAPASASTAGSRQHTVKVLEGPLARTSATTLHQLMKGADPGALGLHAPAKVDASEYRQTDVDRLTRQHTGVVNAASLSGSGKAGTARPNDAPNPPPLTVAACKAAVQAAGTDFYIASRYDICQSDTLYFQFWDGSEIVGGLTYDRTVIGTSAGIPNDPQRQLYFSVTLDNATPTGTVDSWMQFTPSWALTNVEGPSPTQTGSNQSWLVSDLLTNGSVSTTWTYDVAAGSGVGTDDVYSDLTVFSFGFIPGPGWACLQCDPVSSVPMAMRWDNASYASYAASPDGGAVFPYMMALQYSTTGDEAAVAKHISTACTNPAATYPQNPAKAVPGCDSDHPLHRMNASANRKRYDDNRDAAKAVCRAQWGRQYSRGGTLDCDEYPFATTYEGCAQNKYEPTTPANNFSAMPLAERDNERAGNDLSTFLRWNRVLDTQTDDGFYVAIDGATSAPPPPPPIDPLTVGRINGSIVEASRIDAMPDAYLTAEMSNMANLHMNTIVLESTVNLHDLQADGVPTAAYPNALNYRRSTQTDVVSRLLTAADAAGIHVLIGLDSDDRWLQEVNDPTGAGTQADAVAARNTAAELWQNYGSHPSFDGWYLPLSVDNVHFGGATAQSNLVGYYTTITDGLRDLTGDGIIAAGAGFDAVDTTVPGWQDSTAYAAMWQSILPQTDLDVVDLQDGVGEGHADAGSLGGWFTAVGNAFGAAGGNTELFSGSQTYVTAPSGTTTPLAVKTVVADINATEAAASTDWSASYFDYLSPYSPFNLDQASFSQAYSDWAATATGDGGDGDTPPTVPTGVTVAAPDSQTVNLTWGASTGSKLRVAGYTVFRNGDPVGTVAETGATEPDTFRDSELVGSTTYSYQIQAFDGAGNTSPLTSAVTATTPVAPAAGADLARCGAAAGAPGCSYTTSFDADVPGYPDDLHTKLTDGVAGTAALGSAWEGRDVGSYSFTVDLGALQDISQIKSDWLQLRQDAPWDSVNLPTNVDFSLSADGTTWKGLGPIHQPATSPAAQTRSYDLVGVNSSARYVKVDVTAGPGWTMTDELQILGN